VFAQMSRHLELKPVAPQEQPYVLIDVVEAVTMEVHCQ
jgi:hypothetical protein